MDHDAATIVAFPDGSPDSPAGAFVFLAGVRARLVAVAFTLDDALIQFLRTMSDPELVAFVKLSKAAQRTQFQAYADVQLAAVNAGLADADAALVRAKAALTTQQTAWNTIRAAL